MKWSAVPSDAPVIDLSSTSLDAVGSLTITSFQTQSDALACRSDDAPHATLAPLSPRVLTPTDLAHVDPGRRPWLMLWFSFDGAREPGMFGKRNHWALIAWSEADSAFHLVLGTYSVAGFNGGVAAAPPLCPPLMIFVCETPRPNPERVFAIASGGHAGHDYRGQVRTYVLMREFVDAQKFTNGHAWESVTEQYPDLPATAETAGTPRHHDGGIITLIEHLPDGYERVTYTRLFPPFGTKALTEEGAKRDWAQWYPVSRVKRSDDAIDDDRNALRRAYAYLRWVGANAPGRVEELAIVSHAYVRSPLNFGGTFNTNRAEADFVGDLTPLLDAFAAKATFWVTGCNVDGGGSQGYATGDKRLVSARALASVEGITRAHIRLTRGVAAVLAHLAFNHEQVARDFAARDFGPHPSNASLASWQLPSDDEGALIRMSADAGGRTGKVIASDRDLSERTRRLLRWGRGEADVATADALADLHWIVANITWDWVRARPFPQVVNELRDDGETTTCSYTVGEWIDNAREVLSARVHYVAAFANKTRSRPGLRAYGGVPGYDGQHLSVRINASAAAANGETITAAWSGQVTAYRRSASYQNAVLHWMLLFYSRFGFRTDHPLWYLDYSRGLDAAGEVINEFDHQSLEPWPPPWLPP